ncbi:MAG: DUF1189 family protein [Deltaproteobacteria bacterium]|nr:MAG: DUF1189 family protein [Deltaproteobacteria bacterium]
MVFNTSFDPLYFREVAHDPKPTSFKFFLYFTFLQGFIVSLIALVIVWTHYDNTLSMIERVAPHFDISLDKKTLELKDIPQPIHFDLTGFPVIVDTSEQTKLTGSSLGLLLSKNAAFVKYDESKPAQPLPYFLFPKFHLSADQLVNYLKTDKEGFLLKLFALSVLVIFPSFWFSLFPLIPFLALPLWIIFKILQSPLSFVQTGRLITFSIGLPTIVTSSLLFLDWSLVAESLWLYPLWLLIVLVVTSLTLRPYQRQQDQLMVLGLEKQTLANRVMAGGELPSSSQRSEFFSKPQDPNASQ